MSKIKILPENLANKIAAGEVVQRPESVVKELLENSIDAGSSVIELFVRKAGKSLIQVIDDGEGMSEDDAILSIQKHATSKIFEYDDLESLITLGFRGEALSSIAAVSQMEIKTMTNDDELGTLIKIDENSGITASKTAMTRGTNIAIRNLFYNTPARRNFLRSDPTELKHITDTFTKIALSHPEIGFKLFIEDHKVYDFAQCDFEKRISQVFGENVASSMIPFEDSNEIIHLKGYTGKPSLLKRTKGDQFLFLNKRIISSKSINHAIFSSYENVLEKGEYPFYVLYVTLDPRKVDVNIHPSKAEVRFEDDRDIHNIVSAVFRKALNSHDLVPSLTFQNNQAGAENRLNYQKYTPLQKNDFSDRPYQNNRPKSSLPYSDAEIDTLFSSISHNIKKPEDTSSIVAPFDGEPAANPTVISVIKSSDPNQSINNLTPFMVQLHNKYILCQIKTGLMIIDQHVAHERILYEKALRLLDNSLSSFQQLLLPQTIIFDPGSYGTLKEINHHLLRLGFQLKFGSRYSVVIEAIPPEINDGEEAKVLREILDEFLQNKSLKGLEEQDNLAKSFSCKTAIKSGDKLNDLEMRILIEELFATSMPYVCPHGRPIVVKISLSEFDKRFGRT